MKLLNFKCFRKSCLFAILLCLFGYCCLFWATLTDNYLYKFIKIQNAYFVNTPGCRIVAQDVMNADIMRHMDNLSDIMCRYSSWFETKVHNGSWTLQQRADIGFKANIYCQYWPIKHMDDKSVLKGEGVSFTLASPRVQVQPKGVKIIKVACYNKQTKRTVHKDVHFFMQPPMEKQSLWSLQKPLRKWQEEKKVTQNKQPLISVMILGLDSVSHLNFLRQMRKTDNFIRKNLPHVEFWGYNKISNHDNIIPLLTGYNVRELYTLAGWQSNLWQTFKQAGYNTSFGEDTLQVSLFQTTGFEVPKTDYDLRPVLKEMLGYLTTHSDTYSIVNCAGQRSFGDVLLQHIEQLLPHKQRYPFFSFYWWTQGLHAYLNFPEKLDSRFLKLFQRLSNTGITNNTVILLMSTNGLGRGAFRTTQQGMLEYAQPLLFLLYPKWFEHSYRRALDNLKRNSHSLMSTYDIYPTLLDLLKPERLQDERIAKRSIRLQRWKIVPRAISLFLPIPASRTCNSSQIQEHLCLCHKLSPLALKDSIAQRAARFIVQSINKLLEPYTQCHQLQLDAVLQAYYASYQEELVSTKSKREYEVRVQLQTQPGAAQYEGTTRFRGYTLALTTEVMPINEERNQSFCIENEQVKMYCYCKISPHL